MKTRFDRFIQISTVILIPVSIAIAGHLFGLQMKNAELKSQEKRFQSEHDFEIAKQEANWRITKSELVYKFLDALTSSPGDTVVNVSLTSPNGNVTVISNPIYLTTTIP